MAGRGGRAGGVIVLCAVGCAIILVLSSVLVVENATVTGNIAASEQEILRLCGIDFGGSIFAVDEAQIARNLAASGRAELVSVRRRLPQTLEIEIKEISPVAYIDSAQAVILIDETGFISACQRELPTQNYVCVTGVDSNIITVGQRVETTRLGQADAMCAALKAIADANGLAIYSELNVEKTDNMYLITRAGMRVNLGGTEALADKLNLATQAIQDLQQRGDTAGVLDVSGGEFADYSAPGS